MRNIKDLIHDYIEVVEPNPELHHDEFVRTYCVYTNADHQEKMRMTVSMIDATTTPLMNRQGRLDDHAKELNVPTQDYYTAERGHHTFRPL